MSLETGSSTRPTIPLVRLGSVLSIGSFVLTTVGMFYPSAPLLYYAVRLFRPLGHFYTLSICDSVLPGAAVVLGTRAISLGRRACGTGYFVTAIISVLVSIVMVLITFGRHYIFRLILGPAPMGP